MNTKHLDFHLERLEDRRMLAGSVSVRRAGGTLVVTGDAADNDIVISQSGADLVIASGSTSSTNVELQTSKLANVRNLRIDLGGGADQLQVEGAQLPGWLRFEGGFGANLLSVADVQIGKSVITKGGAAAQSIVFSGVEVLGNANLVGQGQLDLAITGGGAGSSFVSRNLIVNPGTEGAVISISDTHFGGRSKIILKNQGAMDFSSSNVDGIKSLQQKNNSGGVPNDHQAFHFTNTVITTVNLKRNTFSTADTSLSANGAEIGKLNFSSGVRSGSHTVNIQGSQIDSLDYRVVGTANFVLTDSEVGQLEYEGEEGAVSRMEIHSSTVDQLTARSRDAGVFHVVVYGAATVDKLEVFSSGAGPTMLLVQNATISGSTLLTAGGHGRFSGTGSQFGDVVLREIDDRAVFVGSTVNGEVDITTSSAVGTTVQFNTSTFLDAVRIVTSEMVDTILVDGAEFHGSVAIETYGGDDNVTFLRSTFHTQMNVDGGANGGKFFEYENLTLGNQYLGGDPVLTNITHVVWP